MKNKIKLLSIIALLSVVPTMNAVTTGKEASDMNEVMPGTVEQKTEEPSSTSIFFSNFNFENFFEYWFF